MTKASTGDTVTFHYTGTLRDGTTFDSSSGRDPLAFELGAGQLIPGLEREIEGMAVGESKRVEVPAAEAYGPYRDDILQTVDRGAIPEDIELREGLELQARDQAGNAMRVKVVTFDDETVRLDPNHPLAGHDLIFDVEVLAIS